MHKLTSKRQITVPRTICDALRLSPGDYVEVFERDGVAHIVKMEGESLAGQFVHLTKGKSFPSSETIKASLKARSAKKLKGLRDSD